MRRVYKQTNIKGFGLSLKVRAAPSRSKQQQQQQINKLLTHVWKSCVFKVRTSRFGPAHCVQNRTGPATQRPGSMVVQKWAPRTPGKSLKSRRTGPPHCVRSGSDSISQLQVVLVQKQRQAHQNSSEWNLVLWTASDPNKVRFGSRCGSDQLLFRTDWSSVGATCSLGFGLLLLTRQTPVRPAAWSPRSAGEREGGGGVGSLARLRHKSRSFSFWRSGNFGSGSGRFQRCSGLFINTFQPEAPVRFGPVRSGWILCF